MILDLEVKTTYDNRLLRSTIDDLKTSIEKQQSNNHQT